MAPLSTKQRPPVRHTQRRNNIEELVVNRVVGQVVQDSLGDSVGSYLGVSENRDPNKIPLIIGSLL